MRDPKRMQAPPGRGLEPPSLLPGAAPVHRPAERDRSTPALRFHAPAALLAGNTNAMTRENGSPPGEAPLPSSGTPPAVEWKRQEVCGVEWSLHPEMGSPPEGILAEEGTRGEETVLRVLPGRSVVRVAGPRGASVVVKTFRPKGLLDRIRHRFLPSPARSERDRALRAREKGVPVPRPLAVGERRRFGFLRESVLVMESVEGRPLDGVLEDLSGSRGERRALLDGLARWLAEVHRSGLVHRDLHPGNILVRREGGDFRFTLVDLAEARFPDALTEGDRRSGLVQMNLFLFLRVRGGERWRALKTYLGGSRGA
ncbi:MAG: lipopolysaccharide kinase InaA family protein, partial [Planctomycetota bacterium]